MGGSCMLLRGLGPSRPGGRCAATHAGCAQRHAYPQPGISGSFEGQSRGADARAWDTRAWDMVGCGTEHVIWGRLCSGGVVGCVCAFLRVRDDVPRHCRQKKRHHLSHSIWIPELVTLPLSPLHTYYVLGYHPTLNLSRVLRGTRLTGIPSGCPTNRVSWSPPCSHSMPS